MSDDSSFEELRSVSNESYDQLAAKMSHIKGWAVDANVKNDPTFPIRHRFKGDGSTFKWDRPTQQSDNNHVLQSVERKELPGVYGATLPAKGISGHIRRYAFRFSEGQYRHWLLLLVADRINVLEGLVDDVAGGTVPHCLDERGINAEWKHNPTGVATKVAFGIVAVGALVLLVQGRKK